MQGHGEKLSRKQEQAIAALLSEPTICAAAKHIGVNEATLYRWLQHEEFQTSYRQARRESVTQAIAGLQQACGEAVQTLREIMTDSEAPASSRVTAARAVLDTALRAVELEDIEERVAALEDAVDTRRAA